MNKSNNSFIEVPNLPKQAVTSAVIGERYRKTGDLLAENGITLYYCKNNKEINQCSSNHADMAAYYFGNGKIVIEKNQQTLFSILSAAGFYVKFSQNAAKGEYPSDILLNCFTIGNKLYCKKEFTDESVLSEYACVENVKQGYCKCSAFIADERSVITDDVSVYNALIRNGLNCLLIDKGDIFLDGIHDGFIGGSGFMYDKNTAVFFGSLEGHRNCHLIKNFLLNIGISCENLSNDILTDIGGIIPLTEKK